MREIRVLNRFSMGEREIFQKKGREQRGRGRFEGREEAV
jgi:hypothetical protein